LSASSAPLGTGGVISPSISRAKSSRVLTPSARHIRSIEPKTLVATGMSNPAGFSNRSPGPPFGDLQARSVTAAISRSGLKGSVRRSSHRRLSRSLRNSDRSRCMEGAHTQSSVASLAHLVGDGGSQRQRAPAVLTGDLRRAPRDDGINEVGKLALE